jgi:hypothetical protein
MPIDLLITLFLDSLWGAITFSGQSEVAIFAIFSFGGYPLGLSIAVALVASMLGLSINWGLGRKGEPGGQVAASAGAMAGGFRSAHLAPGGPGEMPVPAVLRACLCRPACVLSV